MLPQPKIVISSDDHKRLHAMLDKLPDSETADRLMDELDRAEVLDPKDMPTDVVSMHSTVTFTVLSTGKTFTYTLVYPQEVDSAEKLSVTTPVGSALIGLAIGQEIEWPLEGDKTTTVRINAIPSLASGLGAGSG